MLARNLLEITASNITQPKRARRDRNFRLAIPSLIVNNHRPGFSSAQLLIRRGSQSTPLLPRLQITNVIEGIVGAGAEFLQEFWIGQDVYGGLFHLLCVI